MNAIISTEKQYQCSRCSGWLSFKEFREHDCPGNKINRRTIRLPSRQ